MKISADIADTIRFAQWAMDLVPADCEHLYGDKTASSRESSSRKEGTCPAMLASGT